MKARSLSIAGLVALSLVSLSAVAHPGAHDEEKEIPKTCEDLKDTKRFTDDSAFPEVKALKQKCGVPEKPAKAEGAKKPAPEAKKTNCSYVAPGGRLGRSPAGALSIWR